MAQYWVYLNNNVVGPHTVEQLIRLRGFSRQTMVRVNDPSGISTNWMSPADIPELAPIFKAADEQHASASPVPGKAAPKPMAARSIPKAAFPVIPARAPVRRSFAWLGWVLAAALLGVSVMAWSYWARRGLQAHEQEAAQALIDNVQLPATSLYRTPGQYIRDKRVRPRWEFERMQDALYNVSLSWYGKDAANVYAFEVNVQAQMVRGLNTAAVKLLSEGFTSGVKTKPAPAPKAPAGVGFKQAGESRREALESGDFPAVWKSFSRRKKSEMAKAGMSQDGFMRLQNLTFRVDAPVKQSVVKTKQESEKEMLVLIKQTQTSRPDIYVKQLWILEDDEWKLDDEEKRASPGLPSPSVNPSAPLESGPATALTDKPAPSALPGMSN